MLDLIKERIAPCGLHCSKCVAFHKSEIKELRKIILHIQENGSVSNSEVQMICDVSKATATRYLGELEAKWLDKIGSTGVGTAYVFKGLSKGSIIASKIP